MFYEYTDKVVTPILVILAVTLLLNLFLVKTPDRKIIFECDASPDGLCFAYEYDLDVLECYQANGVELGHCAIDSYIKPNTEVCVPSVDDCPMVYLPDRLKQLAKERRGLVVFKTEAVGKYPLDAFCHDTKTGPKCYLVSGKRLRSTDWRELAIPEFNICFPKYENCLLVPAMLADSY